MKKTLPFLLWFLLFLTAFFPLGRLITEQFGYVFELVGMPFFALTIAIVSVASFIIDIRLKDNDSKLVSVPSAILLPLSLINISLFISGHDRIVIDLSLIISVLCCFYFTMRRSKPVFVKVLSCLLASILAVPIGFFAFLSLFLGDLRHDTVIQSVESPDGRYYAEIIDSNQGAMGGNTEVVVRERVVVNAIIFRIEKQPKTVYFDRWGEFKNMKMYWKDNDTLIINSKEYQIE